MENVDEELPFEGELVQRSIAALLGVPQNRMQHALYLTTLSSETTDEVFKALLQTIQDALFGAELASLGQNLPGVYRQAWEAIVLGVEMEGIAPEVLEVLVRNTLVVLGPASDKRDEWKAMLTQIQMQAQERGADQLVLLVDMVIKLIDANGNPIGLGEGLQGIHAKIWQAIVSQLSSS